MTDIQSNTFTSLTKVIDTTQSGYATRGLPTRAPEISQTHALTLNVIAVKNSHILLQEPASGKKLLLEKIAVQGPTTPSLAKGDSLILISANQKEATFIVEKNIQNNPNRLRGNTLQNVVASLNLQWSDVPASVLKKTLPVILNQLQIASNTQQADGLAKAIVSLASASGQPTINVITSADTLFIKTPIQSALAKTAMVVDKSVADALRLVIRLSSNNSLPIDLPLSSTATNALAPEVITELKGLFTNGQKVNVQFNASSKNELVTSIVLQSSPKAHISAQSIKEINQLLSNQFASIKQAISALVVSPHSPNLHKGIVLASSMQNLHGLGAPVKQSLIQGVPLSVIQNASILVGQSQQNTNQIQVSLLAKPLIVSIENTQLSTVSITGGVPKNTQNTSQTSNITEFIPINNNAELGAAIKIRPSALLGASNLPTSAENLPKPSQLLRSQLIELLAQKGNPPQAISAKIDNLQSNIYHELNQALPRAENITQALPNILKQLQTIGKDASGELKGLINQVSQQIKMNLPTGEQSQSDLPFEFTKGTDEVIASLDTRQIKDILTSTVLPNVTGLPIQATRAIHSQSGLVNGLVAMLQASLQAKLMIQQPQLLPALLQSPQFAQILLGSAVKAKTQVNHTKLLQDLARLDPRGNLIGELNKVLSGHSLHKLSSAESSLQNQDSFYYMLPNMFSSQHKDIELMIKREHLPASEKEQDTQQAWQLSMKLDVGKNGDVLAKVKLANNKLDLNLYASNQLLKDKILAYLPYLNKRLESLGLMVNPKCYVGKIPNTLHKTDYQLVQAYV
jgi:hypothetical protein